MQTEQLQFAINLVIADAVYRSPGKRATLCRGEDVDYVIENYVEVLREYIDYDVEKMGTATA